MAAMWKADLVPNVITYSAAISAWKRGQQWQLALGLLAVMRGLMCCLMPYPAMLSSPTMLLSAFVKMALLLLQTRCLLAAKREGDLLPDVITYNSFLFVGSLHCIGIFHGGILRLWAFA